MSEQNSGSSESELPDLPEIEEMDREDMMMHLSDAFFAHKGSQKAFFAWLTELYVAHRLSKEEVYEALDTGKLPKLSEWNDNEE